MAFTRSLLRASLSILTMALPPVAIAFLANPPQNGDSTQSAPSTATDLPALAATALQGNATAVQTLRTTGPAGLEALLAAAGPQLDSLRTGRTRLDDPGNAALREATDAVARQRDAWASGLYWFTDLDAARAVARRTGRPILSLRLLGNLDEDYSCANSRFFRTVLYANAEVSKALRKRFVLHWKSVRPAPLLTIDMGDGRRIKRTITGNSIHYLLDAEGRVLDALPGLYSPQAFLSALDRATAITASASGGQHKSPGPTAEQLRAWHGQEAHSLRMEWLEAAVSAGAYKGEPGTQTAAKASSLSPDILDKLSVLAFPALPRTGAGAQSTAVVPAQAGSAPSPPVSVSLQERQLRRFDAVSGMPFPPSRPSNDSTAQRRPAVLAVSKGMVERPVLLKAIPDSNALAAQDPASPAQPGPESGLAGWMTPDLWSRIAEPLRPMVRLDEASRRLMLHKLPVEIIAPPETVTGLPQSPDSPFGRQLERFEGSIARDMVRNEYYHHSRIHQWLEEDRGGVLSNDVEALNRRIYSELFLTPDSDAWLGLVPEDTYTALEKDGIAGDRTQKPSRPSAK